MGEIVISPNKTIRLDNFDEERGVDITDKDELYSLVKGIPLGGDEPRSLLTRGEERRHGSTNVVLHLSKEKMEALENLAANKGHLNLRGPSYDEMLEMMAYIGIDESDITVPLVQMPRIGAPNGVEWNAPGGIQEPGEVPLGTAVRELDEEAGLHSLWNHHLPAMQFSSGCYDEIQHIVLSLVTGNLPTKLVEGAKQWHYLKLEDENYQKAERWIEEQNRTGECMVDGKVYFAIKLFVGDLHYMQALC